MSNYKEIPEWKKKILSKKGRNKRDRTKILRNQHKNPQIPLKKAVKVVEIIKQAENRNKIVKEDEIQEKKKKGKKTTVDKLVSHFELLIKSSEKNKN